MVSRFGPALVKLPGSMGPKSALPPLVSMVPPPAPKVILLLGLLTVPVTRRPPFMVRLLLTSPRLAVAPTERKPPLRLVFPVYELLPARITVNVLDLVRDPVPPSDALLLPSERWMS